MKKQSNLDTRISLAITKALLKAIQAASRRESTTASAWMRQALLAAANSSKPAKRKRVPNTTRVSDGAAA